MYFLAAVISTAIAGGMIGCSAGSPNVIRADAPPPTVIHPPAAAPQVVPANLPDQNEGSLWQDDGVFSNLFDLPKARQVGDIVTIKVVESSKATNRANTLTERDSSLTARIDAFLGLEKKYLDSSHPDFRAGRNFNPFGEIKGGMNSTFDGSGTTSRSGDLTAFITARVTEVLPQDNLRIVGSRQVEVNNEKQFITVSGVVRTRDINFDNVVLSTFLSDARIAYSGMGVIDQRQRPGWLANLMNQIWPF
jgi:flagellar L-ring protein precursor FlgH